MTGLEYNFSTYESFFRSFYSRISVTNTVVNTPRQQGFHLLATVKYVIVKFLRFMVFRCLLLANGFVPE